MPNNLALSQLRDTLFAEALQELTPDAFAVVLDARVRKPEDFVALSDESLRVVCSGRESVVAEIVSVRDDLVESFLRLPPLLS
ncbi:MAG: hypothetical protein ACOX4G_09400 [Limnochordia bacterium]